MYYTGFADEAGSSIDIQIKATQSLGWSYIESRNVDGINLTDVSAEKFAEICQKLEAAGIHINCFGSAIANWSTDPRSAEDFERSLASLQRAIPRMQTLGTKLIRGMSFGVVLDAQPDSPEIEKLIFDKVRILVRACEEGEVIYLHENCMNYGGMSHEHTLRLIEQVNSPNFRLVFDTGNPVGTDRRIGKPPYRKQSSWEFYSQVREFVDYIHIKDNIYVEETGGLFPKLNHTFPGEGHGDVRRIVKDMLRCGYQGGFSIEPHLAAVYHDNSITSPDEIRFANYVEYGRRFMKMVAEIQAEL